jgi:hypothetical protein
MGKMLTVTLSVLSLAASTVAQSSISEGLYDIFSLYQEYASASYCASNIEPKYGYAQLSCMNGICPSVNSAQSKIMLQLNE